MKQCVFFRHDLSAPNTIAHDDDFGLGFPCGACHARASIGGHWNGTASATADYTGAQVGMAAFYTDLGGTAANRGTCAGNASMPPNGLIGCHSDNGNWARQWSTSADADHVGSPSPAQAVCNVCHGQYGTLANSTGWNAGTAHFRAGAAGAGEDKGAAHLNPTTADACEDCHGYDSVAVHNANDMIDLSDGAPSSYAAVYASGGVGNRWYCTPCHTGSVNEVPTDTSSHTSRTRSPSRTRSTASTARPSRPATRTPPATEPGSRAKGTSTPGRTSPRRAAGRSAPGRTPSTWTRSTAPTPGPSPAPRRRRRRTTPASGATRRGRTAASRRAPRRTWARCGTWPAAPTATAPSSPARRPRTAPGPAPASTATAGRRPTRGTS